MPSEPGTRWQRRKKARPAELLAAALACFKERGFAATRLDDVAAQAGVTKGTIYLYYPSKEELFKAVVRGELVPTHRAPGSRRPGRSQARPRRHCSSSFSPFWAQHVVPSPISVIPKLVIAEAGNFPELARFYLETVVHRVPRGLSPPSSTAVSPAVSSGRSTLSTWSTASSGHCSSPRCGSIRWGRTTTGRSTSRPSAAPTSTCCSMVST